MHLLVGGVRYNPPVSTKRVVRSATIAALYALFTVAIAPISYGPVQFRLSEVLKVFVLYDPFLAFGIGIGTFFANLASPFAGPWDLVWMPLTDILGGLMAWALFNYLFRRHWMILAMVIYALTTGMSVGLMLAVLGLGGFWLMAASVSISETIILLAGIPLILWMVNILNKLGYSF